MKPNELYHHGVLGMSWGKRNGPPYPLDAKGKAALKEQRKGGIFRKKKKDSKLLDYDKVPKEQIQQLKEKAIRDGNIKEAYKNRSHYTDQELKAAQTRFILNTEVKDLIQSDIDRGMDRIELIAKRNDTVNHLTNSAAVGAANLVKLYNAIGGFTAQRQDKEFKQIPTNNLAQYQQQGGGDSNKKKKKK